MRSQSTSLAVTLLLVGAACGCAARKALTYALGRPLTPRDDGVLAAIRNPWATQGTTLRALVKRIVLDETFRYRRGGGRP